MTCKVSSIRLEARSILLVVVLLASAWLASACKPQPQTAADWTWAAPGAPATTYSDAKPESAAWISGKPSADLESALTASARAANLQLTPDARLARLALFCAERLDEDPSTPLQALAVRVAPHLGIYDPTRRCCRSTWRSTRCRRRCPALAAYVRFARL